MSECGESPRHARPPALPARGGDNEEETNNATDGDGGFPAGAELHQPCQLLAASGIAQRFHLRRILPDDRPRAGGGQVPCRLLRRSPGDAGPLWQRPSAHGGAWHPLREDGPDHRADGDGHGDRTPRSRRHVLHHLFRTVPRGARVRHAGPDDRRTRGVERGDVDERRRSAEHGHRRAHGARLALRPGRRVHGRRARPLEFVGRRRDRAGQADRAVRRIPTRCGGWIIRGSGSARAVRSPCRARRRASRW